MEQLDLGIGPAAYTADTCNSLFENRWSRPVRQSAPLNGRRRSRYEDLGGFGSAHRRVMAAPVRWQRTNPFNLMPQQALQLEVGQRNSPLRLLGQMIMAVGLISFGFAGWYLWGTGILTAGEQSRLSEEFQERLLATSDVTALPLGEEAAEAALEIVGPVAWDNPAIQVLNSASPELEPIPDLSGVVPEPAPAPGEALGRIVIPKAEVDWIVSEGITPEDLRNGPGHVIGSAMPGQVGNTVISGHRTTNGAPFYHLDLLEPGDTIVVKSVIGEHTYEVVETRIVEPSETWVATQWSGSWLTLTTCTPRFSSSNRLIVFARLIDGPNAEVIHARFGTQVAIPGP